MSIINGSGISKTLNGVGPNSLDFESVDGEESFVVLERSTANDISIPPNTSQAFGENLSFPVFNNHPTFGMVSSHSNQPSATPSLNHTVLPPITNSNNFQSTCTNISLTPQEIEKRLQEVLIENINLKENLFQTNLAMKQQLSTVSLLQDRALESQKKQQAKFEETKALILKLSQEKTELQEANSLMGGELNKLKEEYKAMKETNLAFGAEAAQLLTENSDLKKQLSSVQENLQTLSLTNRKTSLQMLQPTAKETELLELVDQLTRKLEAVERSRRQQEFDLERLQAQAGRLNQDLVETQRKLAHTENTLQDTRQQLNQTDVNATTGSNENPEPFGEKLAKYTNFLRQLQISINEEQTKLASLSSWLSVTDPATGNSAQFEISELRRLLVEEQSQSVSRKEHLYQASSAIQELLTDFQAVGKELEKAKAAQAVQESHSHVYDEVKKKGYIEKIDELTAQLVQKEEELAISKRHFDSLQEAVRLNNEETNNGGQPIVDPTSSHTSNEEILKLHKVNDAIHIKNSELEARVKDLTQKVHARDERIRDEEAELNNLKDEVLRLKQLNDAIPILQEQAKVYLEDFEAERKSRELLVAEKERFLEDLRHLQRRNQELIDELNKTRNDLIRERSPNPNPRPSPPANDPPPPRPQDEEVPPPKRFYCPNPTCNLVFTTLDPLQLHVITCLKLDD